MTMKLNGKQDWQQCKIVFLIESHYLKIQSWKEGTDWYRMTDNEKRYDERS